LEEESVTVWLLLVPQEVNVNSPGDASTSEPELIVTIAGELDFALQPVSPSPLFATIQYVTSVEADPPPVGNVIATELSPVSTLSEFTVSANAAFIPAAAKTSIAPMAIAAIAFVELVLLNRFFAWFCIVIPIPHTIIILCDFGNAMQYRAILK
jgi:hypothetical protein